MLNNLIKVHKIKLRKKQLNRKVHTCLTIVKAVVPLWKASRLRFSESSLSTAEQVRMHDCFQMSNWQSFLSGSREARARASCQLQRRDGGKESLTLLDTKCPHWPWPSKIPQKIMSSWHPNSCHISIIEESEI